MIFPKKETTVQESSLSSADLKVSETKINKMSGVNSSSTPAKKGPTPIVVIAACLLGIALGLFGLNYWHASKCSSSKPPDEMEKYIEAINRRLLQAESQVLSVLNCRLN